MNEWTTFEDDPRIDTALDSYPLVPLPPGFVSRMMGAVLSDATSTTHRAIPRATLGAAPGQPRFRLQFLDLAVPIFLVVFFGTLLLVGLWAITSADPIWFYRLERELIWFTTTHPTLLPAASLAILGTGGLLLGSMAIALWYEPIPKPRPF